MYICVYIYIYIYCEQFNPCSGYLQMQLECTTCSTIPQFPISSRRAPLRAFYTVRYLSQTPTWCWRS